MTKTIVYVGCAESQDIHLFDLRADGGLDPFGVASVQGAGKADASLPLALSPDRRFLYAALRGEPYSVATFTIDPKSGALKQIANSPLAAETCYIAADRTGRWLFSASYQGSRIAVSPIGPDGVPGAPASVIGTKPSAHCILPDPSNRFVLNTSLGGDVVYQWTFDPGTGALVPNDPPEIAVRAKAGPRHVVFSPDARFVYLLCELDGALYVFPWDAARGRLGKEVQVASALPPGFSGTPSAADIHATPDGRFLYASERGSNTLAAFAIEQASGRLTAIGHYPTETMPRGFAIDPAGRTLLAVGQKSHSMTRYTIDPQSGALAAAQQYPVGRNPNWIEFVALG